MLARDSVSTGPPRPRSGQRWSRGPRECGGGLFAPVSGGRAGAAPYDHWGGGAHGGAHPSCTCIDLATLPHGRSRSFSTSNPGGAERVRTEASDLLSRPAFESLMMGCLSYRRLSPAPVFAVPERRKHNILKGQRPDELLLPLQQHCMCNACKCGVCMCNDLLLTTRAKSPEIRAFFGPRGANRAGKRGL